MTHTIDIDVYDYNMIKQGKKTFLLCRDNYDFIVGDRVFLKEFDGVDYTQRHLRGKITYFENWKYQGIKKGYVLMSIKVFEVVE